MFHFEFFFGGFNGDDVFEGYDFGGALVGASFFEGEEVVVGQDDPPSELGERY